MSKEIWRSRSLGRVLLDLSLRARGAVRTAIQSSVTHQRQVEKKQGKSMKRAPGRTGLRLEMLVLESGSKPLGWPARLGCNASVDAGALTHLPIHYHVGLQGRGGHRIDF